jgi:hypothetical protein
MLPHEVEPHDFLLLHNLGHGEILVKPLAYYITFHKKQIHLCTIIEVKVYNMDMIMVNSIVWL